MEQGDARKRNMERRRETSRYAARDRRGKEAEYYNELKNLCPVVDVATVTHLDRIALLRVSATYCRFKRDFTDWLEPAQLMSPDGMFNEEMLTECLDGFILLVDTDGTVLYITESVAVFLGLTQTDLTGRHLRDFMDASDYDEYTRVAMEMASDPLNDPRHSVMRMKSVISPRGRNLNLKSALFKPVSFFIKAIKSKKGKAFLLRGTAVPAGQGSINSTATALTKSGDTQSGTYMTRHTSDMRLSYVSDGFAQLLRSDSRSLMGASFYGLLHPLDAHRFTETIGEMFRKGNSCTGYYRLLGANRTIVNIVSEATSISHTTRGQKGQYIICIHHLLGICSEEDNQSAESSVHRSAGMAVNVKQEIEDTEYMTMGRQPQLMDCVQFTPLIGETALSPFETIDKRREDDGPQRKHSYDEVLQWLFRDQPGSPPWDGRTNGPRGAGQPSGYAVPLSSSQSPSFPEYTGREERGNSYTGGIARAVGQAYSPPSETLARCDIRADLSPASGRAIRNHSGANRSRLDPSLPQSDCLPVSADLGLSGDLFTSLPPSHSQNPTLSQPMDPYPFDDCDFSGLAPFIPHNDMLQLNGGSDKEFSSFFPDIGGDWSPAECIAPIPAGRPVREGRDSPPLKKANYGPELDDWPWPEMMPIN